MKKMNIVTLTVVFATVAMMLTVGVPVSADEDIPTETYSIIPPITNDSGDFPSKLDLRDQGLVTSIKTQSPYGTCWAHAAITCCETNLIKNGYEDISIDLSELHLAYYVFHMSEDPLGGLKGDYVTTKDYLLSGANDMYSTFSMSAGRGVVLESDVPYSWSSIPDLDLEEKYQYSYDKYVITNVKWINPSDTGAVKTVLNSGDSVAFSYYFNKGSDYSNQIIDEEGNRSVAYYYPDKSVSNHDVAIIGYDDNYSADNFAITPPGNGAWLIKNSWGTENEKVGSDGCVWISYYSTGLDTFAAYELAPVSTYDNNYQYDGGGSLHQNITYGNVGYMSNVFTANGNEKLNAVSFYTMENIDVEYEIQIFTDLKDLKDPTSGTPALMNPQIGKVHYAGYHTIELNEQVDLKKGETFSVVIILADNEDVYLAIDKSANVVDPFTPNDTWAVTTAVALPGQSFASADGETWDEISADGTSNLRVKAFTVNEEPGNNNMMLILAVLIIGIAAIAICWYALVYRKKTC